MWQLGDNTGWRENCKYRHLAVRLEYMGDSGVKVFRVKSNIYCDACIIILCVQTLFIIPLLLYAMK